MKNRSFTGVMSSSLLLAIALLVIGGTAMIHAQGNNSTNTMEGSLATADKTKSSSIPPIDSAAPTVFETVSFGLG